MNYIFDAVINLESDLAVYNMAIANYNFNITRIQNLLIELADCPTEDGISDLYCNITEAKEECCVLLEEIKILSSELIYGMQALNKLLEDFV